MKCVALITLLFSASVFSQEKPPAEPEKVISWLGENWTDSGWGAGDAKPYIRPLEDQEWKTRMLAMQALVKNGNESVAPLTAALQGENNSLAIFAAQTLGFFPKNLPKDILMEQLRSHKNAAVRLYAADALGMTGDPKLKLALKAALEIETQNDVKKHLNYAIERDSRVDSSVLEDLKNWDSTTIGSAEIGKPAPDFTLRSLGGDVVKLSDFRGKSAVVLVFIYGDT